MATESAFPVLELEARRRGQWRGGRRPGPNDNGETDAPTNSGFTNPLLVSTVPVLDMPTTFFLTSPPIPTQSSTTSSSKPTTTSPDEGPTQRASPISSSIHSTPVTQSTGGSPSRSSIPIPLVSTVDIPTTIVSTIYTSAQSSQTVSSAVTSRPTPVQGQHSLSTTHKGISPGLAAGIAIAAAVALIGMFICLHRILLRKRVRKPGSSSQAEGDPASTVAPERTTDSDVSPAMSYRTSVSERRITAVSTSTLVSPASLGKGGESLLEHEGDTPHNAPIPTRISYPTLALHPPQGSMDIADRFPEEDEGMSRDNQSSQNREGERSGQRSRRYETDAGVRLAGGRPGERHSWDEDGGGDRVSVRVNEEACSETYPPPYSELQ